MGYLLVNLLFFVGGRDLPFGKKTHHLYNENSLKIDNCHIDCKLKWKQDNYLGNARHNIYIDHLVIPGFNIENFFSIIHSLYSDSHIFNNEMVVNSLLITQFIIH